MRTLVRPLLGVLLVVSACDRQPPEAKPAEAKPAETKTVTASPQPAQPQSKPAQPDAASVERALAQQVLDHPRVAGFLHLEVPANVPLRVAPSPDLAQGAPTLQAGGQAVRVVPAGEARVVFKGRERVGPTRERVRFEIPAEGVVGHVDLELDGEVWTAVDASVAER